MLPGSAPDPIFHLDTLGYMLGPSIHATKIPLSVFVCTQPTAVTGKCNALQIYCSHKTAFFLYICKELQKKL